MSVNVGAAASALVVTKTWLRPRRRRCCSPTARRWCGRPGEAADDAPVVPAVLALPQVLAAADVDGAAAAGVGRDRRQVAAGVGRGAPRRDLGPVAPVVGGPPHPGAGSGRPEAAGTVQLARDAAVVDDVPPVPAVRALPAGRGHAAGRLDLVVLQRADDDVGARVGLAVDVVEQSGLQATAVQRIKVRAIGRHENAAVVAGVDGRRPTARLLHERPGVRVRVQPVEPGEVLPGVNRAGLPDRAEIDDVVDAVTG